MGRYRVLATVIFSIIIPVDASEASTIIHDETFAPSAWTASIFSGSNLTGTVAVVQQTDGRGTGSNSQQVSLFHNAPTFTFDMEMLKNDRPWVPAVDGEIVSFLWKLDYLCRNTNEDPLMYATAIQNGTVYASPYFVIQSFSPVWRTAIISIDISHFTRIGGPGPVTPDFSMAAAPLEFGYGLQRGNFESGDTFRHAVFHMEIETIAARLPGDFNRDGNVDAADYVIWRDTLGQTGPALAADGNRNDAVDAGDYDQWRANFGIPNAGGGSGATAAVEHGFAPVPEPSSVCTLWVALAFLSARRRSHDCGRLCKATD